MNYWLDKKPAQTPAEYNRKSMRRRTFIFRQMRMDRKKIVPKNNQGNTP